MWLGQFTATDLVFTAARQRLQSLTIKYNALVLCEEERVTARALVSLTDVFS